MSCELKGGNVGDLKVQPCDVLAAIADGSSGNDVGGSSGSIALSDRTGEAILGVDVVVDTAKVTPGRGLCCGTCAAKFF